MVNSSESDNLRNPRYTYVRQSSRHPESGGMMVDYPKRTVLNKFLTGAAMGATVGMTIGLIYGLTNYIRTPALRGQGQFIKVMTQYMTGSACMFSFFMGVGSVIRTEGPSYRTFPFHAPADRPILVVAPSNPRLDPSRP